MTDEQKIAQLIQKIADDPKYAGCVFEGPGIYFAIVNGEILTISNDASCSPRGGWFPDIVSHPSEEKETYLAQKMNELGFDEDFFYGAAEEYGPDGVECYFEDEENIVAIELKSVRPNSGETRGEKQKILKENNIFCEFFEKVWKKVRPGV